MDLRILAAEAAAIASDFENVTVAGEPIAQRRGHLGVSVYTGPFAEAEVSGDEDACAPIKFARQVEEESAAGPGKSVDSYLMNSIAVLSLAGNSRYAAKNAARSAFSSLLCRNDCELHLG